MSNHYDVLIVGGGVTGCSTACFLAADDGFDGTVAVIERDPSYTDTPSTRATGGVRQQFSTPENVQLGLFGAHFVKHIGEYLAVDGEVPDVGWREQGYLLLATPERLAQMQANHAVQRAHGAQVGFLTPEALLERFPWFSTEGLAGAFLGLENEGWLDPWSLLQAYRRKARAAGVVFIDAEVTGLRYAGRQVSHALLAGGEAIGGGTFVDAAGARGATAIARSVGVEIPVEPRRRCVFVFDCREDLSRSPLTILPEGVAYRPEGRGFIVNLAPPAPDDPPTLNLDIDYAQFEDIIWPTLAARVPAFEAIKLASAYACHYDVNTLDENVIVGATPDLDNFLLATGFSGHGLQQSPAIGRALTELVVHGAFRTIDLTRFGYERVLTGAGVPESNCY